ncbi:MAG: tetratricopeptide repeat protein, partial [Mycobacterium sp.]
MRPILHVDLGVHGGDGAAASEALLGALRGFDRPGSGEVVRFPGAAPVSSVGRFPLRESLVFSALVPPRDMYFTGRVSHLDALASGVAAGGATALVQAVEGLGGAGKSAVAVEHCYRSRASVDIVWWVRAEEPDVGFGDLAALAGRLGVPVVEGSLRDQAVAVRDGLSVSERRWLLVIDNVEDPAVLEALQPTAGNGQVVITARKLPGAVHVDRLTVDVFSPQDADQFLERRLPDTSPSARSLLAERVGRLALALEQAAAYLIDTGIGVVDYVAMLTAEGLGAGDQLAVNRTVSSVFRASIRRAAERDALAGRLMDVIGFLAPEAIPRAVFTDPAQRQVLGIDTVSGVNSALAALAGLALVETSAAGVRSHHLVQEVARDGVANADDVVQHAARLIFAATPDDTSPSTWTAWELLFPHVLAVLDHAERRSVADQSTVALGRSLSTYLRARGSFASALEHAERAAEHAQRVLGPDHPETISTRHSLS